MKQLRWLLFPALLVTIAATTGRAQAVGEEDVTIANHESLPVEVYLLPGEAGTVASIIEASDPTRPLELVFWSGEYRLDQPVIITRDDVTLRPADATQPPRFIGVSTEAPLFYVEGGDNVVFNNLEMSDAMAGIIAANFDGLTVEECDITTSGPTVFATLGKRAVLRDNVLVSRFDPYGAGSFSPTGAALISVDGIKVTGNTISAERGQGDSTDELLGLLVVGDWEGVRLEDPSALAPAAALIVRNNLVMAPGEDTAGVIVGVSFGPTYVEDNIIASGTGLVVPVVDFARATGSGWSAQIIAGNVITASGVGIVGTGAFGHMDIHDNVVTLLPLDSARTDLDNVQVAAIVAAKFNGTVDVAGNDLVLPSLASPVPQSGIWQIGPPDFGNLGFAGIDDSGLNRIANNRILGGHRGIVATNLLESSAEIAGNEIGLGAFGEVGISAIRIGGAGLYADFLGPPPQDYVDHPFGIFDNDIYTVHPTTLIAPPDGIVALSLFKSDETIPLVIAGNALRGVFDVAIAAQGNPVEVSGNRVTGSFRIGVDTANPPELELEERLAYFEIGIGDFLPPDLGSFDMPPATSRVRDNVLTLAVPKKSVTPVLNEPGAYLHGNLFGYLVPRPWGP